MVMNIKCPWGRKGLSDWPKGQNLILLQSDSKRLKLKEWANTYQVNAKTIKSRIESLISDKIKYRPKSIKRGKERHFR